MRRSSSSPSHLSFSSLPYDVVLNCLARISTYHPILSLVSKSFRSILASPDLQEARSRVEKTEKCLYVCLNLNNKPTWFVLSPAPKRKLIPVPSRPDSRYQHPSSSTVVSLGSEIYLIGGYLTRKNKTISNRVFVLDCKSNRWRQLPNMIVPRTNPGIDVIDGNIHVTGGCTSRHFAKVTYKEAYDAKTQSWEPTEMGKNHRLSNYHGWFVNIPDSIVCSEVRLCNGELFCSCDAYTYKVSGLQELYSKNLVLVCNSGCGGSRVTVWWKTYTGECTTEIWCAQILIQYTPRRVSQYRGIVEWSENVFTYHKCESDDGDSEFLLHYALVTYD